MAEENLALIDANKTQQAEEGIADILFGPEETEDDREEAGQEPVVEGDDEEEEEVEQDDEGDEDEETTDESEFVEVEYDGKLYEVPTELKDALLRQGDYTAKTQEVAAQRKETEVIRGQLETRASAFKFAESIRDEVSKAEQLEAKANEYHQYLRNNIDNLSSTDIEKIRLAIEDARSERDGIVNSVQGKHKEFQQAQEQSMKELLDKGTEVLRSKIPQWGESHQKQVRDYGLGIGFTEQELSGVVDPRQVEVLWKASQYDHLQSGKAAAVKRAQDAPKTIKPRVRDEQGRFKSKKANLTKALKSNLPASQKANLIGEDIASRFFS